MSAHPVVNLSDEERASLRRLLGHVDAKVLISILERETEENTRGAIWDISEDMRNECRARAQVFEVLTNTLKGVHKSGSIS